LVQIILSQTPTNVAHTNVTPTNVEPLRGWGIILYKRYATPTNVEPLRGWEEFTQKKPNQMAGLLNLLL